MNKGFCRDSLITGDIVKNSKGSYGIVLRDTRFGDFIAWFENKKGETINRYRYLSQLYTLGKNYVQMDLSFADGTGRITKIYRSNHPHDTLFLMRCSDNEREEYLLWEEKSVKEMTVKEIEEQLGHKVKIVDKSKNDDVDDWLETF